MPTWGEILKEFSSLDKADTVRRKYIATLATHTGRNTILYSTKWTDPTGVNPDTISITEEDVQGFMEVVHGLRGADLDIILHSPGGSPVATEAIVKYLRKKFQNIRIIVPQGAMSAGTMLACAGNRIVMGKHSFLGPIDPQFILPTPLSPGASRMVPAQAILDQFDLAKKECKDSQSLGPWLPILSQFGPALIVECKNAIALSRTLVTDWLANYMFHGTRRASYTASFVARRLAAHKDHKSHGRHLDRDDCKKIGLIVDDLEQDQTLQDLVLSVFHASTITFNITPTAKIIENQNGKAFIKLSGMLRVLQQPSQRPQQGQPSPLVQPQPNIEIFQQVDE